MQADSRPSPSRANDAKRAASSKHKTAGHKPSHQETPYISQAIPRETPPPRRFPQSELPYDVPSAAYPARRARKPQDYDPSTAFSDRRGQSRNSPGISLFSRKTIRAFPCRGQDAQTAARPKSIPRRKRSPPWSSKRLNVPTATKFSTKNTPPRCCGPNAPIAEAERIRTKPSHLPHAASPE